MVEHVERAPTGIGHQPRPRLGRVGEDHEPLAARQIAARDLGVTRDRNADVLADPLEQCGAGLPDVMAEEAEALFRQRALVDAVKVLQGGLGGPADVIAATDIGLRPIEDLAQPVPVVDRLEGQVLDRGAGDDQRIETTMRDLTEALVKGPDMRRRRGLGPIAFG